MTDADKERIYKEKFNEVRKSNKKYVEHPVANYNAFIILNFFN